MNCLHCNTPNEEGAKFCKNCGMDMTYEPSIENTNSKLSDRLLMIFIIIQLVGSIVQVIIPKLFVDFWSISHIKYILASFWIVLSLSFIIIPFSIKNKSLRIIGIIISLILIIIWVYNNIKLMM